MTDNNQTADKKTLKHARLWVRRWLVLLGLLVYAIILVGGATRLTDSGLSITEWKPISGALPPLDDRHWAELFALYQQTAEYQLQNAGMLLHEFKFIYWWEWGHRLLGRLVGLVAILGFVVFWIRGWLSSGWKLKFGLLIALGGLQGAIGWWMVSSGIGETTRIDVAPYRLMTHFCLALLILCLICWFWLDYDPLKTKVRKARLSPLLVVFSAVIFLQMASGALVAGLDAGRTYTDWPMMAGKFIPNAYWNDGLGIRNLFENVATAQFNHRVLAYLIAVLLVAVLWMKRSRLSENGLMIVSGLVAAQIAWGVYTLLSAAPLELALVHQGIGVLVLLTSVWSLYRDSQLAASN
ncbi:MAG: heme A synthase [Ponticaulis sp.]|nr:heme A synthase [Ponticaulis sp.]